VLEHMLTCKLSLMWISAHLPAGAGYYAVGIDIGECSPAMSQPNIARTITQAVLDFFNAFIAAGTPPPPPPPQGKPKLPPPATKT
jgi:hypothetical protein